MFSLMAAVLMVVSVGWSDVVVQYAPLTAAVQPPLRAVTSSNAAFKIWNFSDSTALFSGDASSGTKIYGGMSASATVDPMVSDPSISLVNGRLVVQATGGTNYVAAIKGLLIWDKSNFLTGSALPIQFDTTSSLRISLFRNDGATQWVIRDGGTYYISDVTVVGMVTNKTLYGTNSVQWASWDPAANGGADFTNVPASGFAARTFTNVTAVGLYFTAQRGANLIARFALSDEAGGGFTANLKPVYENTTSLSGGEWSSSSIWSGGTIPTSADHVDLFNAATVTINSSAVCANLNMGNQAGVSRLWLQSGSLTAAGINMSGYGTIASSELNVSGGALNVPVLRVGDSDTDATTSTRVKFSGGTTTLSAMKLYSLSGSVEVAVSGSGAAIYIGSLEAVAGASQPYRLTFITDSNGVAPIQISGAATMGSNRVSVAIDFADYNGEPKTIDLLTASSLSGSFADITVQNLTPYLTANISTKATGLSIALTQSGGGLAITADGRPIDIEMKFIDPHWQLRWPTARGKRYQVQVSRDGLQSWQNHGEAIIGTGMTHYSYVPMETMGRDGFARVMVSDRTGETQPDSQPNILMIVADDMNDWPGFDTGHSFTPNLDKLAASGLAFRNAHISTTYCTPSRTALMTGKHPASTGFYANNVFFYSRPDLESLPAYFKRAGYETYGAGKVFHHMPGYIDLKAYTEYFHWSPAEKTNGWPYNAWSAANLATPTDPLLLDRDFGPIPNTMEPYMADTMTTDYAIAQLQATHTKPFFMTIGTYAPHLSRFAPQKYFDLYNTNSMYKPEIHLDDLDDLDPSVKNDKTGRVVDYAMLTLEIQAYHACVTYADAQHGRILDALAASAYASNTIVVFWSDNGYHLGEKLRTGKHTVWERTSNVPYIWAGPGIPTNTVYDHVVELLDTYPTLVEMAGLPKKDGLDGTSLVPIFQNPTRSYGRVAVQVSAEGADFAVITDDYRYIYRPGKLCELYDWRATAPGGSDTQELRNLINDPAYASVIAKLRAYVPTNPAPMAAVSGTLPGGLRLITAKKVPSLGETYYWEVIP